MGATSAGLLMYRGGIEDLHVFLVHPGGPFFHKRDEGAWSIPKGEVAQGEDPLEVALREFEEETGRAVARCAADGAAVAPIELGAVKQRGGKTVLAWCFPGDWPAGLALASNTFETEWPPRSGRRASFPEVDRAEMLPVALARRKINGRQAELLDRLEALLRGG